MFIKNNFFKSIFAINVFLGAFLLFLIQPLIGKILTPVYGGVSQIWILCLFFFQITLLGGYTLTFYLSKLSKNWQAYVYIGFIVLSLCFFQIPLGEDIKTDFSNPISSLLQTLGMYLAIPLIFTSSISTLMQNWFGITRKEDPYFLYSLSNTGSVLALLLFPLFFEPNFSINLIANLWKSVFWLLAITAIISAVLTIKSESVKSSVPANRENHFNGTEVSLKIFLLWVLLSFMGTSLLLSYTSHITQDIAPVPLLWILPLMLYLMTFIVIFGKENTYNRFLYLVISFILLFLTRLDSNNLITILLNLSLLYSLCMVCHGELYNLRPQYKNLPIFYLSMASGGALGGVFINLIAPFIFNSYVEFILINVFAFAFLTFLLFKHNLRIFFNYNFEKIFRVSLSIIIFSFIIMYTQNEINILKDPNVQKQRNFYGTAVVTKDKNQIVLKHGQIVHGYQAYDNETEKLIYQPTSYYTKISPFGVLIETYRNRINSESLNICAIGLGTGTVAAYGKNKDVIDFYELDPKIVQIAEQKFSFIKDSKAKINIILGDGRLNLKKNSHKKYDIILIDAFNGDAIPVHLLTKEALNLYLSHLKDNGLIFYHVSNNYLKLNEVVENIGIDAKLKGITIYGIKTANDKLALNTWYSIISKSNWINKEVNKEKFLEKHPNLKIYEFKNNQEVGVWTDNFSNIISIFKN